MRWNTKHICVTEQSERFRSLNCRAGSPLKSVLSGADHGEWPQEICDYGLDHPVTAGLLFYMFQYGNTNYLDVLIQV